MAPVRERERKSVRIAGGDRRDPRRLTEFVSLYDSLYKGRINPDSLRYVPFSNGKEFELTISSDTSKTGVITHGFEAKTPFVDYLGENSEDGGLDKQEIINLLEDCDDRGRYRGM